MVTEKFMDPLRCSEQFERMKSEVEINAAIHRIQDELKKSDVITRRLLYAETLRQNGYDIEEIRIIRV